MFRIGGDEDLPDCRVLPPILVTSPCRLAAAFCDAIRPAFAYETMTLSLPMVDVKLPGTARSVCWLLSLLVV